MEYYFIASDLLTVLLYKEFVDEAEPSYVAQSNPQYAYGTYQSYPQYAYESYHSHVEQQHMNEYEEGANDFEEVDNDFEQGAGDEEGADNDHVEPNPDVSFETRSDMSLDEEGDTHDIPAAFDDMGGGDCGEYAYMLYPHGSQKRTRFLKYCQMRVGQQRALCWDALRVVGEEQRAAGPSHRPLMVEFLSTFRFAPRPANQSNSETDDPNEEPPPPEVSFCLFGQR
ncbi:hypothetical protein L1987_09337 [Smallanthus sonchifolius]|uniref:Uncharacterized protein n=1 Tax=Smallanthus sonchifolius TaxID=185202 RepID=A0ACB9JPM1_9ASTR|nr:hypothetical protein L1987_09337 [Smallanthus sonchifolius]